MERKEPKQQSDVAPTPETATYSFDSDDIQSINIEAISPGGVGPKASPRFRVQIMVVPKPPPV